MARSRETSRTWSSSRVFPGPLINTPILIELMFITGTPASLRQMSGPRRQCPIVFDVVAHALHKFWRIDSRSGSIIQGIVALPTVVRENPDQSRRITSCIFLVSALISAVFSATQLNFITGLL